MSQTKAQLVDAVDGSIVTADLANDAVNADKLASNAVVNASVDASAAIAGSKISPDFGSQNITTTGNITAGDITANGGDLTVSGTTAIIHLTDTNNDDDFSLMNENGNFRIRDATNSLNRLNIDSSGNVGIPGNLDVSSGLDVTGALSSTGDITITNTNPKVQLVDSNSDSDFQVQNDNGNFNVRDTTNSSNRLRIDANGDHTFSSAAGNASFTFTKSNAPSGEQSVTVKFDRNGTVLGGVGAPTQMTGGNGGDMGLFAVNGNTLRFGTGTGGACTEKVSIDQNGHMFIADGNLVISTAGHGIDFSAQTQSSSTTTSELLDHYEEGTWTPTTTRWSVSESTANAGKYTRIGNFVQISWNQSLTVTNGGYNGGGSGAAIGGLPFTVADCIVAVFSGSTLWTSTMKSMDNIGNEIFYRPNQYSSAGVATDAMFNASGVVKLTATYRTS